MDMGNKLHAHACPKCLMGYSHNQDFGCVDRTERLCDLCCGIDDFDPKWDPKTWNKHNESKN